VVGVKNLLAGWRALVGGGVLIALTVAPGVVGAQTTSSSSTTTTSTVPAPLLVDIDLSSPFAVGPNGTIHVEGAVTNWSCTLPQVSVPLRIVIGQPTLPGAPGYGGYKPSLIGLQPPGAIPTGEATAWLPCDTADQSWAVDVSAPDGHPFQNGPAYVQAFIPLIGHVGQNALTEPLAVTITGAPDPDVTPVEPVAVSPAFTG
jgi:hypothetical protein